MRRFTLLLVLMLLSACSTTASPISAVTPLPASTPTVAPTLDTSASAVTAASTSIKLSETLPNFLKFSEMYSARSVRYGLTMSDYLKALDGKLVQMEGYMAPPLRASLTFFVLTEYPMSLCPFCASTADWPDSIILVYLEGMEVQPTVRPIRVTGKLEIGYQVDAETGFVSMVRLHAQRYDML